MTLAALHQLLAQHIAVGIIGQPNNGFSWSEAVALGQDIASRGVARDLIAVAEEADLTTKWMMATNKTGWSALRTALANLEAASGATE